MQQRWEYKTIPMGKACFKRLNQAGDDGWELVAIHKDIAYLKRVILQPKGAF